MKTKEQIETKISSAFTPSYLTVINESHQHNVAENSETHFKVVCVSEQFAEMSRVKRHQHLYSLLADELSAGVHALALHLYTAEEWNKSGEAPSSPQCLGGSKA